MLDGVRVLDFTRGIPGAYCTKLLADAGADVVKVESAGGDPLRRWTASHVEVADGDDGALFRFLHTSKRSVTSGDAWLAGADIVVEGG
ncbi:MAG TPA: CoA transferase, partial [Acidimicrobiales bacterium]